MPDPHVPLNTRSRKLALVAGCLGVACVLVMATARPWRADRVSRELTHAALERAAALEPDNADRQYQLGRFSELVDQNFATAADAYQRATELNPHVAAYWLGRASVAQFFGDGETQKVALGKALEADPSNPSVAWDAANFFLVRGEISNALPLYRTALRYEPGLTPVAVSQLWRKTHDATRIAEQALPPAPIYYAELLKLLIDEGEADAARNVWRRWASTNTTDNVELAFPYLDFLLKRGDVSAAHDAWTLLAKSSPLLRARTEARNLVSNGDFEHQILNGGFEWRYTPVPSTVLELDTTQFHSGNSSLSIRYEGASTVDTGISQFIPVSPNTTYTFRGYMRGEEVYAAHGPRFAIIDQQTGAAVWKSAEILGTASWQECVGSFTVGPDTRLLAVGILRDEPTRIKGRVWIDDVFLAPGSRAVNSANERTDAR